MKHLKILIIVSLIFSPFTLLFSQEYINLARLSYNISNDNAFDSEEGETSLKELSFDLNIPIPLSKKKALLTGLLYENIQLKLYSNDEYTTLHTVNLKAGVNQKFSKGWDVTYLLLPKFSSDLIKWEKGDFQIGAVALIKKHIRKNFNYKFGAYYNSDKFGPFVTPLIGLYYRKGKWETNITLPASADGNFSISKNGKIGLRFDGAIRSFNLNTSFEGKAQYVRRSNNELSGYLQWNMKGVNFQFQVGTTIGRNYRTYEESDQMDLTVSFLKFGDFDQQLNQDFSDGLFFKTSIFYQLNL